VKRAPDNVRNQGYFRRHMLTLSFTARDPKPTWSTGCCAQAKRHARRGRISTADRIKFSVPASTIHFLMWSSQASVTSAVREIVDIL
jgi:hypothetical protein